MEDRYEGTHFTPDVISKNSEKLKKLYETR
jgi:hypothetical protein